MRDDTFDPLLKQLRAKYAGVSRLSEKISRSCGTIGRWKRIPDQHRAAAQWVIKHGEPKRNEPCTPEVPKITVSWPGALLDKKEAELKAKRSSFAEIAVLDRAIWLTRYNATSHVGAMDSRARTL